MFALAGLYVSARRTVLVAVAVILGLVAALLIGPAAAHATLARHDHHQRHAGHKLSTERVVADALLGMVNNERHAHGLPSLIMNSHLIKSAHVHNVWMARTDLMSHQEAGEPALASRISRAGYKWSWAGENIGWNSAMTKGGVLQLESIMYNEKAPNNGHRLNILNKHFTNIGVDVYLDHVNKKVWLTTDFGRH